MFQKVKHFFYFPVASYFRFFAAFRLKKWNPKVIVITGSSGKTTLLHLVESQLGNKAKYSHEANSSFGIPFDILGIHRKTLTLVEWPAIFIFPILNLFKPLPKEKIYIVEADCDRPNEGRFLSKLLKPEITLWTNVSRTHSVNFESLVKKGVFESVDKAIAFEFGHFAQRTGSMVIVNADSDLIQGELKRITCDIKKIFTQSNLRKYGISIRGTEFETTMGNFTFPFLLPKETLVSIMMCLQLIDYLHVDKDIKFSRLVLPPGRNSFFKGIKGTTIVDSSYNANLDSMKAIINMFENIKAPKKWMVLGDMLEQGLLEKEEHEKLALVIDKNTFDRLILMGPRVSQYTYPNLVNVMPKNIVIEHFINPNEVLKYLLTNITGGEVILFKGARFLEGVVGNLLINKDDIRFLARREKIWEIRRKKWGI
jgi:UDP-N-acetylmuramyl pentapeptide synthase